MKHSSTKTWRS